MDDNVIILIHPPISKPGEPPAGIARLAGALSANAMDHRVIDANLEGQLYLLGSHYVPGTGRSEYAYQNRGKNIESILSGSAFKGIDHYRRIVGELNQVLHDSSGSAAARLDMAEFNHATLSPVASTSLIYAAEHPEENPFYRYFKDDLLPKITQAEPDLIGISVNFLSQAICSFALAGLIRRMLPKVKIIMGGGLITTWMSTYTLGERFRGIVDSFIPGPGEEKLLARVKRDCRKVFYQPDYSGLPVEKYLSPGTVLPFSASHGCYWQKCEFCPEKTEGGKYVPMPVSDVLSQLTDLCSYLNPALIHFLDNAIQPVLLQVLARGEISVPWYGYVRFIKELEDPGFCGTLKKSGCSMLKIGLESGSQRVLDAMGKGIRLESASRILRNLKQAGIPTYVYVLFGTPTESESEALQTMEFVKNYADCITFLNAAIFNMPINSIEKENVEAVSLSGGDLSLYTGFQHPRGWDRKRVRHFLDRTWKRDPVVSRIIRRTPLTFTSNHAPLFKIFKPEMYTD